MAASSFTGSGGTRLAGEPCDRYDTSWLWNLG
jgi:hypothetical protein